MKEADNKLQRETFGTYYQGWFGGGLFRWLDWMKIHHISRALGRPGEGYRVLDMGSGSAGITARLARRFPQVTFVAADVDPALLEMAAARGLETHQVDFDKPLPFSDHSFDAILMIDSIEHVQSRARAMAEIRRLLRGDELFVACTPPYDTVIWCLAERMHRWVTRRRADHISPFTRESMEWLLGRHFTDVGVRYTNAGLSMFGVARGLLRPEGVS